MTNDNKRNSILDAIDKFVDQSTDSKKEWLKEPHMIALRDPETHYDYFIIRHPVMGHLCGYVEVIPSHPAYRLPVHHEIFQDLEIHGGITFSGYLFYNSRIFNDIYVVGFDCAHWDDYTPYTKAHNFNDENKYKNIKYVENECLKLCKFIKHIERKRIKDDSSSSHSYSSLIERTDGK